MQLSDQASDSAGDRNRLLGPSEIVRPAVGAPVVTEVCALYQRRFEVPTEDGEMLSAQDWLRHEWLRSGLPLYLSNEACGVIRSPRSL